MRKGIYFSFDALLATMIIAATLGLTLQSSQTASSQFKRKLNQFEQSSTTTQDAIRLASLQKAETAFTEGYQDELITNTILTEKDMNKEVIEVIAKLWAYRNHRYVKRTSKRYFNDIIKQEYALKIKLNQKNYLIYNTSSPDNVQTLAASSTLISGFKLGEETRGYRARATLEGVNTNTTSIYPISPAGTMVSKGGKKQNYIRIVKVIQVEDYKELHKATLDIATREAPNEKFRTLMINGQKKKWDEDNLIYQKNNIGYFR
ncbi:MAG: hypothetical protein ABEI78_01445, partial [Candidatus Nanohaloarchaea archaeon]